MPRTVVTTENAPALAPVCPSFRGDARAALESKHEHDATTHSTQDTYQTVFPDIAKAAAEATASLPRGTPVGRKAPVS